jgi:hypothetical protein
VIATVTAALVWWPDTNNTAVVAVKDVDCVWTNNGSLAVPASLRTAT